LTVSFTVGGTAVSGVDYFAITNPVTIPTGAFSAPVTILPKGNGGGGSKTIVATLTILGSYRSAPGYSADTVTLVNLPTLTITAQSTNKIYGAGLACIYSPLLRISQRRYTANLSALPALSTSATATSPRETTPFMRAEQWPRIILSTMWTGH